MNNQLKKIIGPLVVKVIIDPEFRKLLGVFNSFPNAVKEKIDVRVIIKKANTRSVSHTKNTLIIQGADLDKIQDPYNYIGIQQAVFRFIALNSIKKKTLLLHASASFYKTTPVLFGDDGASRAKTLSSLIVALSSSHQYIGDEFCFYNLNDNSVTGFASALVHLRPEVSKYLAYKYGLKSKKGEALYEKKSGYFIKPQKYFKLRKKVKFPTMCFVHFKKGKIKVRKLSKQEKNHHLTICVTAHILKFLHPHLDRMQFINKQDSDKNATFSKSDLKKIIDGYKMQKNIEQLSTQLKCYSISINNPSQLTSALDLFD
ncbi:hypothetical protein KKI23_01600 [Patescibacteria group bacterium]|nr:hypothetical protein [Patescibacteria group bacterium]